HAFVGGWPSKAPLSRCIHFSELELIGTAKMQNLVLRDWRLSLSNPQLQKFPDHVPRQIPASIRFWITISLNARRTFIAESCRLFLHFDAAPVAQFGVLFGCLLAHVIH